MSYVGDYIRKFSVSQFNKHHKIPEVCRMLGTISESFLSHSSINIIKHQRYVICWGLIISESFLFHSLINIIHKTSEVFHMLRTLSESFLSQSSINIFTRGMLKCWQLYKEVFCLDSSIIIIKHQRYVLYSTDIISLQI